MKNIVMFAALLFTCNPAQKPATEAKLASSSSALTENSSVSVCGDPGFIVKNCSSQDFSGDWYTIAASMSGNTAFLTNPSCVNDECIAWCWGPFGDVCCGNDSKAVPRNPSTYSSYVKAAKDVALVHSPGQYAMWCSTNANHASVTHLYIRSVSQPL